MITNILNKLNNKQLIKNFLILLVATFLGKGISFIKEIMVANYFGTSSQLDVIIFSLTLAGTILTILSSGMEGTVLPNYLRLKKINLEEKNIYLLSVLSIFFILIFFVSILIILFKKSLIELIAPGFSIHQIIVASGYLSYFNIYIIFGLLSVFFIILLKAEKKFFLSGIMPSFIPISILCLIILNNGQDIIYILYGVIIGSFVQLVFSFFKSINFIDIKRNNANKITKYYNKIFKNYSILLGSGLFIGLITLTDQSFASIAGEGAISSLNYSQKLPALLDGILIMILGTILFSEFAENVSNSKHEKNKKLYFKSIGIIFISTLIISLILALFSKELIELIFVRGKFDYNSLIMVYPIQAIFFLKLPFVAIAIISARMMNSFELNKEMLYINFFSFLINAILDYLLVINYGTKGIAFATLITYIWASALNFYVVIKHFKRLDNENFICNK